MFTSHTLKRLTVATLGALLLAAAAAAPAGAVWSGPKNVSPQFIPAAGPGDVAMDADGDSYIAYAAGDMVQAKKYTAAGATAWTKTLTPRPTDPEVEPPGGELPSVGVNAAGDSIYAWLTTNKSGARSIVQARTLSRTGVLGPVKTIVDIGQSEGEVDLPEVGVDADGDAIVAWTEESVIGVESGRVKARALSKAGVLGATQTLSSSDSRSLAEFVQVGVRDNGDALFAWQWSSLHTDQIQIRTRLANGTLTRVRNVSPFEASLPDFDMAPDGDAIVAWLYADPFAGGLNVQARTIAQDGTLGKIKNLSPRGGLASDVHVALNSAGTAAASFEIKDPVTGSSQVYGRTISPTGALGKMQTLSAASQVAATDTGVGISSAGRAVFSWLFHTATGSARVEARTLTPTGTLGTRKVVHSGLKLSDARLAVAPSGQATATWLDQEVSPRIQASFGP
jgi:hypothetical protein